MFLYVLRLGAVGLFVLAGFFLAIQLQLNPLSLYGPLGGLAGFLLGILLIMSERRYKQIEVSRLFWSLTGLIIGLVIARFFLTILHTFPQLQEISLSFYLLLSVLFGYTGMMVGYQNYESLSLQAFIRVIQGNQQESNFKILDTSVIIDGRIADICETGFIEGTLIIPQFILKELQHIADSSDVLKRNRGRRGLDILQKIQKLADVDVQIVETDFPKIREVDAKLVELAKTIGGKILTNDFNLNKIAELQGIHVLNVNELANALKPVVLPGEVMNVHVLKEGKESGQGVAYLDDGTMVVVDNAINAIGRDVEVSVTSVLQTTAGRMIFSKLKEILS